MNRGLSGGLVSIVFGTVLFACAAGVFEPAATLDPPSPRLNLGSMAAGDGGVIAGLVQQRKNGGRIAGALVILMCTCLSGQRETTSDGDGVYRFEKLPPGRYTVQVLYGQANLNKSLRLTGDRGMRVNFAVDPDEHFVMELG